MVRAGLDAVTITASPI